GAELVPVAGNLVDAVWTDQPAAPAEPVEVHPESLAGEAAGDKLARLAEAVRQAGADAAVLTDPSSLAWAFNLRGHDVPHTPLALGFAVIAADGRHAFYMDERKLTGEAGRTEAALATVREPSPLAEDDRALAAERLRLLISEAGGMVIEASDPARLPRATKNRAELAGTRAAHRRDGAAVTRFLCWLDRQEPDSVDEIGAARQLEQIRATVGE